MPERLAAFDAWGAKLDALMRTETSNVTAIGARTAGRALADDRRRKLA
jgi:hypothetical protein